MVELGDFRSNGVNKVSNKNDKSVYLLNYMDVYNQLDISNKNVSSLMEVTATDSELENNSVIKGDVFFTPSSETAIDIGKVHVISETFDNLVYSYHLMRFRPIQSKFYLNFPKYSFSTEFMRYQLVKEAQGAQRFILNMSSFNKLVTNLPSVKEQSLITKLLETVDNNITLHQHMFQKGGFYEKHNKKRLIYKILF